MSATALLPLHYRLERVGQHIVRARIFIDLWFYFEERKSREYIIETMRDYNEFFRFTPHAYLVAYVIYMAGVFDRTKGTISLSSLFKEVEAGGFLDTSDAQAIRSLCVEADLIAKKVSVLRHNAFAHRSARESYDDVFKVANVKPEQLRHLTDIALRIENHLLLSCGLPEQFFTDLPKQAAESMMRSLANAPRVD